MKILEERGLLREDTKNEIPRYIDEIQVIPLTEVAEARVIPKEPRVYQVPDSLSLNFFELVSKARWEQAKALCVTCKF